MPAKPTFKKNILIELLQKFEGDIKQCMKVLGIESYQTIHACITRNPEVKEIWLKIKEKKIQDSNLLGTRFGSRIVIAKTKKGPQGHQYWLCRCDCGSEKEITGSKLLNKRSHQCLKCTVVIHGMYNTPEYQVWSNIIQRCTNPNSQEYHNYGARGITLWDGYRHDFLAFLSEVGPRPSPKHSIDRINNTKGYEPKNLRWATAKEQTNNRRITLQVEGTYVSCKELSTKFGINHEVVRKLINRGCTMVEIEKYSKISKDDWHGLRNFFKERVAMC